jgi:uncharacterized membrane protein YdjX (TVP38/TMEM64 family)
MLGMPTGAPSRLSQPQRWGLVLVLVLGLVVLMRVLPLAAWVEGLREWAQGLGSLGLVAFGVVYVVGALLFVPGSWLTLVAGAAFGLWWGTLVVSLASTAAAAASFWIARYLARARVEELARRNPRFRAVDRAIEHGGWRVVALLRLSPAIPYSVSNYLYGLTSARFVPYLLASWIAMLPATFVYVYIGHIGHVAAESASGAKRTPQEYALIAVGILATIVLTVYLTKLARRALAEEAQLDDETLPATPVRTR